MLLSEKIHLGLSINPVDFDVPYFSFEDMEEAFKFGLGIVFESTDDYYAQIEELQIGLLAVPEGTPKYSKRQFEAVVEAGLDVFRYSRTIIGHEQTFKGIIETL